MAIPVLVELKFCQIININDNIQNTPLHIMFLYYIGGIFGYYH